MNKGIPKNGPLPRPTATPRLSWWPLFIFWAPSKGCLGLALHFLSWRGADCTIPKYASLVYLLFWADIFEKLQTQKKFWNLSIKYPFVREIYIRKRLVPGRELIPQITFSPERLICLAHNLCVPNISSSHFPVNCIFPFEALDPWPFP